MSNSRMDIDGIGPQEFCSLGESLLSGKPLWHSHGQDLMRDSRRRRPRKRPGLSQTREKQKHRTKDELPPRRAPRTAIAAKDPPPRTSHALAASLFRRPRHGGMSILPHLSRARNAKSMDHHSRNSLRKVQLLLLPGIRAKRVVLVSHIPNIRRQSR